MSSNESVVPAKFSRYRSVRNAQPTAKTHEQPLSPTPDVKQNVSPLPDAPKQNGGGGVDMVQRSMSRYRKRPTTSGGAGATAAAVTSSVPGIPGLQGILKKKTEDAGAKSRGEVGCGDGARGSEEQRQARESNGRLQSSPSPARATQDGSGYARSPGRSRTADLAAAGPTAQETIQSDRHAQNKRALREQEYSKQQQHELEEKRRRVKDEERAAKKLAEQKRKDLERLEIQLVAAAAAKEKKSPVKGRFKIFGRGKSQTRAQTTDPMGMGKPFVTERRNSEPASIRAELEANEAPPRGASSPPRAWRSRSQREKPEPTVVELPGTDAPKSAVNSGERRVLVRCKQSSIALPVTPSTTPTDLIYSAANTLAQNIDPTSSVLVESYKQLGLERRLRLYEHVREIMNSWDRDTQNSLVIEASDSVNYDVDLKMMSVPAAQPPDATFYLYHSQKPGKWNKRYITLFSNGQIAMSKKSSFEAQEKDTVSLCHLSDFDIYTPTTQQLRKTLKPPKKHCYAIKSQQKTTVFLSTENYVHFFCTDDASLAKKWYTACQTWRSWYLVNASGSGPQSHDPNYNTITRSRSGRHGPRIHLSTPSGEAAKDTPYTIGSFKPLLGEKTPLDEEDENRPRQIPIHLRHGDSPQQTRRERPKQRPPISYPNIDLPASGNEPLIKGEETFAPGGLLGRTYTKRQQAAKEKEMMQKEESFQQHAFISGTLLHDSGVEGTRGTHPAEQPRPRTSSESSRRNSLTGQRTNSLSGSGLARSCSKCEKASMPKPLVDLTPVFQEAPQWRKEGKGHGVAAPEGVPLVEVARTRDWREEEGMPGTVFRRQDSVKQSGGRARAESLSGKGGRGRDEGAFVKGSLLERMGSG